MTETRHHENTTMQDRRSFDSSITPLLGSLQHTAMRLTKDQDEAADLVQDTVVRALRFAETFQPGASIKAWLFTILRNTFINGYHRKGRERTFVERALRAEVDSRGLTIAGVNASSQRGVEDAIASQHTRERIAAALAQLPADFRLAVTLADLEGFSYKEIATIMDCPVGTVMSRIFRGRKALHTLLLDHAVELGMVELELAA